jgi:RNA polymerase sigma-70 factor (ECF subfamily)
MTDHTLIARFRQGDAGAFDVIVRRHEALVRSVLYRLTGNADDAEDLAQETFLRVFENLARFRGDAALRTWILRIAANLARDRLRRRRRRPEPVSLDGGAHVVVPAAPEEGAPPARLALREMTRALAAGLEQLPFKQRAALTLKIVGDMNYGDIALALDMTRNAVKSNIHHARKRLTALLGPQLAGPGDERPKGESGHGRLQT